MNSLIRNFRRWWQPPRRHADQEEERSITFLELFFDLVYVVIIAELAHALSTHADFEGMIRFAFLFGLVWLAWLNGALYHDLHGNNDIRTRVFTFLQMFTVAAMAVFAHNAFGEGSVGFALSFAGSQFILTYLWWRTGVYDPDHRPLSQPYSLTFLISTLLFVVSAFVPVPWRFYLWAAGLTMSLLVPLFTLRRGETDTQREQPSMLSASAIERFGLFTIIVLGEVIVAVVSGVASHHHLTWTVGVTAGLGMLSAIGLWWIYFDFISQHSPKPGLGKLFTWNYLHLLMTMGIVATGAATLNVVEHAGEALPAEVRWLLVGAIALALACIAVLMRSIQIPEEHFSLYRTGGIVTFISGSAILLLGLSSLPIIPLLILIILLMLTPVFYGINMWLRMLDWSEAMAEEV